eukprot:gene18724-52981_t
MVSITHGQGGGIHHVAGQNLGGGMKAVRYGGGAKSTTTGTDSQAAMTSDKMAVASTKHAVASLLGAHHQKGM